MRPVGARPICHPHRDGARVESCPKKPKSSSPHPTAWRPADPLVGAALIRHEAKLAPDKPGVYRMLGGDGEVLYVGKAKSLKKRVLQYAQGRVHAQRIARMVQLTREMVLIRTDTEGEALLLEARLIKALKPRYNVLLRDDKMFAEILVRKDHAAPQITKHRGAHTIEGNYYGPFASTGAVNQTLDTLQKAFLLRTCTDSTYASRTRPCMLHQIKRCSAPCTGVIGLEAYNDLAQQADAFLRGKSRTVIATMSAEMMQASDDMDFERAAHLRDRVRALNHVAMSSSIDLNEEEADIFAAFVEGGSACVQVVFYRAGQNWGDRAYFPRIDTEDTEGDGAGCVPGPVLPGPPGSPPDPAVARPERTRPDGRGALAQKGAPCHHRPARSAGRNANWSSTPPTMRGRLWAGAWPNIRRSRSCCRAWPRPSGWRRRRYASRFTTTRTSAAPMPSVA